MKRTIFLLVAIVLIGIGWSAGWFFVEGKVLEVMDKTTSRLAEKGREVTCSERATSGFPFRIGLNCRTFSYSDNGNGIALKTGQIKSVAQVYQPNKVVMEMTEPLTLNLPDGNRLNVKWESMRGSAKAGLGGPDRFSIAGRNLSILPATSTSAPSQIAELQIHGRKQLENDVQLAASIEEFESELTTFPILDASFVVTFANAYRELIRRPDILLLARQNGLSGNLDGLRYAPEDAGYLELVGPFELDRLGMLSGKFQLTISEGKKVFATLAQGLPRYSQQITQAGDALALLSKASGNNEVTVPFTIKSGKVSLGIVPIGDIGPLF